VELNWLATTREIEGAEDVAQLLLLDDPRQRIKMPRYEDTSRPNDQPSP